MFSVTVYLLCVFYGVSVPPPSLSWVVPLHTQKKLATISLPFQLKKKENVTFRYFSLKYIAYFEVKCGCFVLDQEMLVISMKILDIISEITATAKNVWTEFVLKISKFHYLSQNSNSSIFCLLRKGTEPEGNIYIIEISLLCHKQRYSRTDVNKNLLLSM